MPTPLATFAIFTYKQENYIKAAIEGAFSQTYSPLEIIISDDCSPDGTFAIVEEMAAAYKGPHTVIINRNPQNLGLGNHVNKVFGMARGEWIFTVAGDDISLPLRVERFMKTAKENPKTRAIGCHCLEINSDGESIPAVVKLFPTGFYDRRYTLQIEGRFQGGCVMAYHRDCWNKFGPLLPEIVAEDVSLCYRAGLAGGVEIIGEKLVKYRRHDFNLSHAVPFWEIPLPETCPYTKQVVQDIHALEAGSCLTPQQAKDLIKDVYRYRRHHYYRNRYNFVSHKFRDLLKSGLYISPFKDWSLLTSKIKHIAPQLLKSLRRQ